MKTKKLFALIMVLALALAACGTHRHTTCRDVLLENGEFALGGEKVTLGTFMDGEDPLAEILSFTVLDMDGDGEEEVLLRILAPAGDAGGFLVLRQGEKGVEGWRLSNRALWELKEDGTFTYSEAAGTGDGIASLTFGGGDCTLVKHLTAAGEMFAFTEFTAEGERVSGEEFYAAWDAQSRKPEARWLDFTDGALEEAFPEG